MPEFQKMKKGAKAKKKESVNTDEFTQENGNTSSKDIIKTTDELLDEIDKLLDPLDIEFVKNFVQAGGQ